MFLLEPRKENLIYYALYAVAGVALVVYIAVTQGMTFERMMGLAIVIGNTFGLLLVIVLLSIGLVRIPRNIWRMSRRPVMLKHYMWHISDAFSDYEGAKRQLMEVLKIVRNAERGIGQHDHNRKVGLLMMVRFRSDVWTKYLNLVLQSCPPQYSDVVVGEGE